MTLKMKTVAQPRVSQSSPPFRKASVAPNAMLIAATNASFKDSRRRVIRRFGISSNIPNGNGNGVSFNGTQYFLARGGISDVSTASNSNFGSSASGAKYAFVVFSQFLSSRSGKSGL